MANDESSESLETLLEDLESLLEDLEIAALVRERSAAGPPTPLSESAARLGLNHTDYP